MRALYWLIGLLSGACITSAVTVFGSIHLYKGEIDALRDDLQICAKANR